MLVPREGVLRPGGQPAIFGVEDGKAHLQMVDAGLANDKAIKILAGIQPGDLAVVSIRNLLNDAPQVNIVSN